MKKILILLFCGLAFSCSHGNIVTNIDFPLYTTALDTQGRSIQVSVKDNREDRFVIGHKFFGSNHVNISSNQALAPLLQDKIIQNLIDKGFKSGDNFTVTISLQSLQYQSNRGFIEGNSQGYAKISVIVNDNIKNTRFSKDYEASNRNNYFIVSSNLQDQENINNLLQDLISSFLVDGDFLNYLESSDPNSESVEKLLKRWYMLF